MKTDSTKRLHRTTDPESSVQAAENSKKFTPTHEAKIRHLLTMYPCKTSKELEELSKGTENELTHTQINKRIATMLDVYRNENLMRAGCHPLELI